MNTRASGIRAFGLRCVASANKRPRLLRSLWWPFTILCFAQWRFLVIKNGGSMAAVQVHILFVLLEERFA